MPRPDQLIAPLVLALLLAPIQVTQATVMPDGKPRVEFRAPMDASESRPEPADRKGSTLPPWLERMIERGEVRRVTDLGRYYRVTPPCCDRFDTVHDRNGRLICEPSGGIGGDGGTSCPREVLQELQAGGEVVWSR